MPLVTIAPTPRKSAQQQHFEKCPTSIIVELKRCAAAESLATFAGTDKNGADQEREIGPIYHGFGPTVGMAESLIAGHGVFGNLWEGADGPNGPERIIPPLLHNHNRSGPFIAGQNVTRQLLERRWANQEGLVTGRTIRNYADAAAREARKMLSLMDEAVREKILKKEPDGEYGFPSGKTMSDFVEFVIFRMYHWETFNGAAGDRDPMAGISAEEDEGGAGDGAGGAGPGGEGAGASGAAGADGAGLAVEAGEGAGGEAVAGAGGIVAPEAGGGEELGENGDALLEEEGRALLGVLEEPPARYFPTGLIFFLTRGPLSQPPEGRAKILQLNDILDGKVTRGSRKDSRKQEASAKAAARDYELGLGKERGLAFGATSQKDVVVIAQQQDRLAQSRYENKLIKAMDLLHAKQAEITSTLQKAELYHKLKQKDKVKAAMDRLELLEEEQAAREAEVKELEDSSPAVSAEADRFLKRARKSMGIEEGGEKPKANEEGAEVGEEGKSEE